MIVYPDRHNLDLFAECMFAPARLRPALDYGAGVYELGRTVAVMGNAIVNADGIALPGDNREHDALAELRASLSRLSVETGDDDTSNPGNMRDAHTWVSHHYQSLRDRVVDDELLQQQLADQLCRELRIYWIDRDSYVLDRYYDPPTRRPFLPDSVLDYLSQEVRPWFAAYRRIPRRRMRKWIDSVVYTHFLHGALYHCRRQHAYLPSFSRAKLFAGATAPTDQFMEALVVLAEQARTPRELLSLLLEWRASYQALGIGGAPIKRRLPVAPLFGASLAIGGSVWAVIALLEHSTRVLLAARLIALGVAVCRRQYSRRSPIERIGSELNRLMSN